MRRVFLLILAAVVGGATAGSVRGLVTARRSAEPAAVVSGADVERERVKPAASAALAPVAAAPTEPLTVRGYIVRGKRLNVVLSDGRTLTERDRELTEVTRAWVMVDGQRVFLRQPADGPAAAAPAGQPAIAVVSPAVDTAMSRVAGAWRLDWDGVWRLVDRETLPVR